MLAYYVGSFLADHITLIVTLFIIFAGSLAAGVLISGATLFV
jgi:hypothetical protein